MQPLHVGVREAKAHLSRLLKMVQEGREVVLTDRGKPVGRIVPVETTDLPLTERIRRLEEQGLIERKPASKSGKSLSPIPVPEGIAQKLLQEERELG